jgi:hypothetical protein
VEALVPLVLSAWVVVCVVLFGRRPGPDAAVIALVGGWALLPTGRYPASVFVEPAGTGGSMHSLALPVDPLINKATTIGLGCLAGVLLFDWPAVRRLRPAWVDLPILAWCLVPFASALANGLPATEGLRQTRYLVLTWGVPYLLGRVFLTDPVALRRFPLALVLAGLLYLPLCLVEFVLGPFLYTTVYGPHPYQLVGAERYLGSRPMVFLEGGNQLGMWIASAAVSAAWLWRAGRITAFAGLSAGAVTAALVSANFLFQSLTAVVVMLVSLAFLLVLGQKWSVRMGSRRAWMIALFLLGMVVCVAAFGLARRASDPGFRALVRGAFQSIGKESFTWRLARYEEQFSETKMTKIAQRPILGWSRPDWSASADHTLHDPIGTGLWFHTLGRFGLLGLASSTAVLLWPVVRVLRRLPARSWRAPAGSVLLLTALLLAINLADSLLNSTWLLPLVAGAGGLNSWHPGEEGADPPSRAPAWKFDRVTGLFRETA